MTKMIDTKPILVVDDVPANLMVVVEILLSVGYPVWTATDGEAALKRLQTDRPALILLDIQMPKMDGFETCRRIKANAETAHIPIIFLTVLSETKEIAEGFSLGAVDYITKPFRRVELLARVRTHVQLYTLTQTLEQQVLARTTELQTLEARQRKLFETSPIGLVLCRMDGSLIDVNATYATIIGRTIPETLQLTSWDITPETYATEERLRLESLKKTGHYGPYEKEYIHKEGHLIPVQLSSILLEQNGETLIWSSVEDISDRKQAERLLTNYNCELERQVEDRTQALQASEQRYSTLAEMLPTGIFLTDLQGHSRYNNPSCCQMLGLTREEALGKGWSQTLHPEDRDWVFKGWHEAAQSRQMPYKTDCRFQHRDGTIVWLSVQAVEELDPQGNPIGFVGSLTDITERKAAEAALNDLVAGTTATIGKDFFPALVHHISKALNVPLVLVTQFSDHQFSGQELQSLAFIADGEIQPNFTYHLPDTPCRDLVVDYTYHCPSELSKHFPNHPHRARGMDSYLGVALRDSHGQVLGSLCIFDRQPLRGPERARQILNVFGGRVAAELERQRTEKALENLIAGTAVTNKVDFFPVLVRYLTEALGVTHALMAELVGDEEVVLAYFGEGQLQPIQSFSFLNTPCDEVYERGAYYCELQPCQTTCSEFNKMAARSYLGVALYDRQGNAIGLLSIFHRQVLPNPEHAEQIMRVFAARAATELERQRAENALQNLIEGTAALTGPDFFPALVEHIATALNASHAFVTEAVEGGSRLSFLAAWADGEHLPNDTVDAAGTTCALAIEQGSYYCERDVIACFPENPRLAPMGVDSYMGVALTAQSGQAIGTLCVFSRQPIADPEHAEQVMRVFGARAATEIERQRGQMALEQLNTELEQRVEQRTQELARSEQDLRTIFNNVYDAIFIHDLNGTILDVNDRTLEQLGATREQILASTVADLSAPEAPIERIPELFRRANAGEELRFEWKDQRLGDGVAFDVEVSLKKVVLGNRAVIVAGVRDISDRKAAEQQLQRLSERLELAIESAQIGIWDWNGETNRLSWDQRMFEIYGVQPEDFKGTYQDWRDRIHPEDLAQYETGKQIRTQNQAKDYAQELRVIRPDGTSRYVLATAFIKRNAQGQPIRMVGTNLDITDRKAAEKSLNLTQFAMDKAALGIFWIQKDGLLLEVNESAYSDLGYSYEELKGRYIWDINPELHSEQWSSYWQSLKQNSILRLEVGHQHRDGSIFPVEIVANYLEYEDEGFAFAQVQDISDRKKAETEILKALEWERDLNEMKSRFVSNTSHEFRTPLTVISNNAELLKLFGDKLKEEEKKKCLENILNYVDHTTELIDDVLIVSRAESGKITLKPKLMNVVKFSQQILHTISLSAPNHHFKFVMQDTRPQPQKQSHSAHLDRKILQQSLTNLLTNAIKYSPEGSAITLQLEFLPSMIEFRIIDEGMGIPEDDQKYLFEPFHRAANVGTIQGTGLGLSIVKHLIAVHQGSIKVKSTLGKGSCFMITIPIQ